MLPHKTYGDSERDSAIGGSYAPTPENVLTRLSADASTILYSTYFGDGKLAQQYQTTVGNHKLALAGNGIAYITGVVNATHGSGDGSFERGVSKFRAPIFAHGQQYIAKFDTTQRGDASLIYCTPIGIDGQPGPGTVEALGVDSQKNLWVYGDTDGSFPTTTSNALQPTALNGDTTYLLELNPAGTQELYGTFFGGSLIDTAYDMTLDANDNVYALALTESSDYPLKNAAYTALAEGNKCRVRPIALSPGTPLRVLSRRFMPAISRPCSLSKYQSCGKWPRRPRGGC